MHKPYICQVLDKNFSLGNIILPVSMSLLQYCPSPQRYASDYQPPNYSLWLLEPTNRLSWLQALCVILYKVSHCQWLPAPNFPLWLLEPTNRLSWLQTLCVILYKEIKTTHPSGENNWKATGFWDKENPKLCNQLNFVVNPTISFGLDSVILCKLGEGYENFVIDSGLLAGCCRLKPTNRLS